ncbi:uncharacterized protein AMSG_00191 [Thecamonas trahens ATCC 50062]|uniref:Nucleolar GTP-binding protein 1 n=1 Tax=Thecamonas trahens ATCC 50062 TaxID=461836 RepID=A0A0L0D460_THETB|nr:hypothetical protein AMSG_00191 [Thecamonas trahens ATCC 50062]KNC46073.1 hypothetical protein AMSG_00191 [Thecamonas trahens ATCC 50062]|eukprot:XP_013763053.1 hypothetical protein AMSG_00191 [Thecamonas trahens ATCC 50062]
MPVYSFKSITVVPSATDFIDICLSKTQRQTPTVVRTTFHISRIRQHYTRSVRFAQQCFADRLRGILDEFPVIDELHPFMASLMNVLYDRDHYKLALGQIATALRLVERVGKDYIRLLKFGDSLYRCKTLKRAALGRMCTILKKQKSALAYLEQVRQHLSRLPSIDPTDPTLLVCGFPNCGKSTTVNKLSRADVDVQPWAFTTQSLFVGHFDYKYTRWQVVDSPGVLDHPLQDMNTIEMQSITALAHLKASILFFLDISEQCGYSIEQQVGLFRNITPLFANKPLTVVLNKIDVVRPNDLDDDDKALIQSLVETDGVEVMAMSGLTEEGLAEVKASACDRLLAQRQREKLATTTNADRLKVRLHKSMPVARDDIERPPMIPSRRGGASEGRLLLKDIEARNGGAGKFSVDLRAEHILENEDWRYDVVPEILDGHNVADFLDPDILARLDELEREEEERLARAAAESDDDDDPHRDERKAAVRAIKSKKILINKAAFVRKSANSRPLPRTARRKSVGDLKSLDELGYDTSRIRARVAAGETTSRARASRKLRNDRMAMSTEGDDDDDFGARRARGAGIGSAAIRKAKGARAPRNKAGIAATDSDKAKMLRKYAFKQINADGKRGTADRVIVASKPKWMLSGKRGNGKTDRR